MRWVELSIQATSASVDAVTNILVEAGCGGSVIDPAANTALNSSAKVTGYLPVDDRLEDRLTTVRNRIRLLPSFGLELASDDVTITWLDDQQWETAWKKHFKPVRVGKIIIKPTWEKLDSAPDDIVVEIDPGMAFGTGYHPTTQLCLLALQDLVKAGDIVCDVGTGSAVLAIAAALLGAERVVGLDNDTVAVEVAQANVAHAGLADSVEIIRAESPCAFAGKADLVVANIIAKVLIDLATELADVMKPNGLLVACGIVTERCSDVCDAFKSAGISVVDKRFDGDWVALIGKREA